MSSLIIEKEGIMYKKKSFERIKFWKIIFQKKRDTILTLTGVIFLLFTDFSMIKIPYINFILKIPILCIVSLSIMSLFKETQKMNNLEKEKHIPLMVIVGKSDSEFNSMTSSVLQTMEEHDFDEEIFKKEFGLERDDWRIKGEGYLSENPKEWEWLVHRFEGKLNRLEEKLIGHKIYHLFLNCPTVLAIGTGAVMGTKYEVVLYQHSPGMGKNPYNPFIDFHSIRESNPEGVHILKSRVNLANKFFDVEESATGFPDMVISISAAGHDPKGDVEKAVEIGTCKKSYSVTHLKSKMGGTLPKDADWIKISQELASNVLNQVSRKDIKGIKLCISAPVIIGFSLGMAIGTHSPVSLCNWFDNKQRYYTVLSLNKLNRFRE